MNKIIKTTKDGVSIYRLITEDGTSLPCERWLEKKTGEFHVKLPKDNPSGRIYIREKKLDGLTEFEFETKIENRIGLMIRGGWKSKLTIQEKFEIDNLEARIDEIKEIAKSRESVKLDPNSAEGIQAAIDKLMAKLAKTR